MPVDSAWADGDLADPHSVEDKARRVEAMFAAIAESYDINNRVHSLWRDQAWRRAAVKAAQLQGRETVVDVACGTGDLSLAFSQAGASRVLGVDFTVNMLRCAQLKPAQQKQVIPSWHAGDAMQLPFADQTADVVSIAFGIRNVSTPAKAIAEFYRVLKPGGRLIILEFSLPTNPILRGLYNFYFKHIMPRTATLIARDKSGAYKYLPQSVNTFIGRPKMIELMETAGFEDVTLKPLTFGIAIVYRGVKK